MLNHQEVERALVTFLVDDKGFLRDFLLEDPVYTNQRGVSGVRPDIVAIDPETKDPIAIFEVKERITEDRKGKYINQLLSYAEIDEQRGVPVYLVVGDENRALEFYSLTEENTLEPLSKDSIPTFGRFRTQRASQRVREMKSAAGSARDSLRTTCWVLSPLLLALVIADCILVRQNNFELLTPNRLVLICVSVALLVVPFAQRFKWLGIEYERRVLENEKTVKAKDSS